jgi:hypothetical protein
VCDWRVIRTDSAEVIQPLHGFFFRLSRKREGNARREMTTSPACQTIVQTYFGSLEFLSAAAASFAQVSILTDLVICTTCVDLNLRLHKS